MKIKLIPILLGFAFLITAPMSEAQISIGVGVGVNPCGYNYYNSCPVYAPPVGVYLGGGAWGGDHRDHGRGHARGHGRR